jgi:tRNA-dihydrouridine synthase
MLPRIATALATGLDPGAPPLAEQSAVAQAHVAAIVEQDGPVMGLRNARKHIGWYLASSGRPAEVVQAWRRRLCTSEDARAVRAGLVQFYDRALEAAA